MRSHLFDYSLNMRLFCPIGDSLGCMLAYGSKLMTSNKLEYSFKNQLTRWKSNRFVSYLPPAGFSGTVQIYSTSGWRTELQEAQPLFEHRGHIVSSQPEGGVPVFITSHIWHPEQPRTLLSAASDGSVHVWDWVDQSAGSSWWSHASIKPKI